MYHNYTFGNVDAALPVLLKALQERGADVGSRNGRCMELTHVGITLTQSWQRELTLPFRKANLAAQIAETMWVLSGRNDLDFLSHYLPRAADFSDDGETWRGGYGPRLRGWMSHHPTSPGKTPVDQWAECIDLLRKDPMTRRAVMSIWDPAADYADSKDIPCNDWLSWSSRMGHLDLMVGIRSNDIVWGWSGINAFEWSALLEITAGLLGLKVGSLHFATTSLHMYEQHFKKADLIVQASEEDLSPDPSDSPRFDGNAIKYRDVENFDKLVEKWFQVEYDIRTGSPLAGHYVDQFPEPMFQSWLRVLQWWWSGGVREAEYLSALEGTRLGAAARAGVRPPKRESPFVVAQRIAESIGKPDLLSSAYTGPAAPSQFILTTCALHLEKEKAYGGSWKKRGEMLGIMANIARKVDRLGNGETADETSADTAQDLFVYLAKYDTWLYDQQAGPNQDVVTSDDAAYANEVMMEVDRQVVAEGDRFMHLPLAKAIAELRDDFDLLEEMVTAKADRRTHVKGMIHDAYRVARHLWEQEHKDDAVNADHE